MESISSYVIPGLISASIIAVIYRFVQHEWKAKPKFSIDFDWSRDAHIGVPLFQGGQQLANQASYIHLHVIPNPRVDKCSGWITRLEKLDTAGMVTSELHDTRQLVWAPRKLGHVTVPITGAPRDLDIFRSVRNVNRLELLSLVNPGRWDRFFDAPGRYRLTISISGDGTSQTRFMLVDWRGKWDDFTIEVSK